MLRQARERSDLDLAGLRPLTKANIIPRAGKRKGDQGIPTRTAIEKRIAEFEGRLSPNRRRLLQATLENPDETSTSGRRRRGSKAGVSRTGSTTRSARSGATR